MDNRKDVFEIFINSVTKLCNRLDSVTERINEHKTKNVLVWSFVVVFCFFVLFLLNILTPLISDDFAYMFIYGENVRVSSISDVVQSQINHYYQWGGRSVVHFIAQVLLLLPSLIADIVNTLAYMLYVYLIYLHIKGKGGNSISLFILINLSIWFLQPVFGDTILWMTGSANYLWGTALVLLFLLPFRLYEGKKQSSTVIVLSSITILLLGVIAGWTNENTAGAMIFMSVLMLLYYRSQKWQIPIWGIIGMIGAVVGFVIMIMAPGNYERAGDTPLSLYLFGYRLFNSTFTLFFYSTGPLLLILLLVAVLYNRFPKGEKRDKIKLATIYTLAALAAVYAMVLSPTFPRRALFGVVTFLIIAVGIFFYNMEYKQSFLRQMRNVIISIGLICFAFTFYQAAREINEFRNIMLSREAVIQQAKDTGESSCEFNIYEGSSYIHGEDPFSADLMSRYYEVKIILK